MTIFFSYREQIPPFFISNQVFIKGKSLGCQVLIKGKYLRLNSFCRTKIQSTWTLHWAGNFWVYWRLGIKNGKLRTPNFELKSHRKNQILLLQLWKYSLLTLGLSLWKSNPNFIFSCFPLITCILIYYIYTLYM